MKKQFIAIGVIVLIAGAFGAWIMTPSSQHDDHDHHEAKAAEDFEHKPHRGRMLRDGDFALEITIFEDGVPPEYHVYAYDDGEPLKPQDVQLAVTLTRLDGETNQFRFTPAQDYLRGEGVVTEPHSFDVTVAATYKGKPYKWAYASYEGRTTIAADMAAASGLKTETAGPGTIAVHAALTGRVILDPARSAQVRPRFPGVMREIRKTVGDSVQVGEVLAVIESNESLQTFQVRAPIAGRITQRAANIGEVVGERALFEIADTTQVVAAFNVFPRQIGRVREGQAVTVQAMETQFSQAAVIDTLSPVADPATQTITARVRLDNSEGIWHPGMTVTAQAVIDEREAPLVVRNAGLQSFRDFTVVFAKVGDAYEVRMLDLGATDGVFTEVLDGLKPGTAYVTENSFLIKADIEKSGASHDH